MARAVELLLTESVENLGIVGDVVKVRAGYARNFLLPHGKAEAPTPEKVEALKGARAAAQAEVARVRTDREALIARLDGVVIKLVRSCNDQGVLYGAVTQRDISDQLIADGFGVEMRAVRLHQPLRRVGHYTTVVQFERDLRVEVAIDVLPDRALDIAMRDTRGVTAKAEEPAAAEGESGKPAEAAAPAEKSEKAKSAKPKKAKPAKE